MNCVKCGYKIDDDKDFFPNCGENFKKKKPALLIIIALLCVIILIFCVTSGVSDLKKTFDMSKGTGSFIDDKYIIVSGIYFDYASVFKFSDGDLVQIVSEAPGTNDITKYYGTYEIDGHKLTISVYGSEIEGVLLEDKNIISINGEEKEILDATERKIADEYTMSAFD